MKKVIAFLIVSMLVFCPAYAMEQPALEIWAQFSDNQKALYSVLDEVEEEIETVFEYLGCMEMADGSKEIADMLFIIAPNAEDGLYILDLRDGEFYDHINDKKVGTFQDMACVANTLANGWACGNTEFLWYDSEVKLYMTSEEIQAVLDAAVQ